MTDLPTAVLFACTFNAVRSPMAEALLKHWMGKRLHVESVGVRAGTTDGFMIAVMDEIGIDLLRHDPRTFDDLEDTSFDLIISLSPEAQHSAVEMTRTMAVELEFWHTFDPTAVPGPREVRLDAYRKVRDELLERIKTRFPRQAIGGL